jgi:hypothetical protein
MFSTDWFWDRAGTVQSNGRLVFIGLHNKYGRYEWTDGTQLRYSISWEHTNNVITKQVNSSSNIIEYQLFESRVVAMYTLMYTYKLCDELQY